MHYTENEIGCQKLYRVLKSQHIVRTGQKEVVVESIPSTHPHREYNAINRLGATKAARKPPPLPPLPPNPVSDGSQKTLARLLPRAIPEQEEWVLFAPQEGGVIHVHEGGQISEVI